MKEDAPRCGSVDSLNGHERKGGCQVMDLNQLIRAAIAVAGRTSALTFKQLDALIGDRKLSASEVEALMHGLSESDIDVVDDDAGSEWPRRPAS